MSKINSKVLLLSIVMCFSILHLSGTGLNLNDTIKESKKELIIVNLDESLELSMPSLVQHVSSIYNTHNEGFVTIKRYVDIDNKNNNESISHFVNLLIDSGISEENILIKEELSRLDHLYFTVTISSKREIQ